MHFTANRNAFDKKIVKVVFTGGPCAGKSTSIERIKELIEREYSHLWNVYTVAEAASTMYSTGRVSRAELIGERRKRWQRDMVELCLTLERVFDRIAAAEPTKHTIILCDRGSLDPKVFTPSHMWPEILDDMGTTEDELRSRYDLVVILHTAPETNYTCENNKVRRENPEQARIIDMKYCTVWGDHPRAIEVESNREDGMEEKIQEVWQLIRPLVHE